MYFGCRTKTQSGIKRAESLIALPGKGGHGRLWSPSRGRGWGLCRSFGRCVSASSLMNCFQGGPWFLKQRLRREEGRFVERTKKITLKSSLVEGFMQLFGILFNFMLLSFLKTVFPP